LSVEPREALTHQRRGRAEERGGVVLISGEFWTSPVAWPQMRRACELEAILIDPVTVLVEMSAEGEILIELD
jgi:hypothetical protein